MANGYEKLISPSTLVRFCMNNDIPFNFHRDEDEPGQMLLTIFVGNHKFILCKDDFAASSKILMTIKSILFGPIERNNTNG